MSVHVVDLIKTNTYLSLDTQIILIYIQYTDFTLNNSYIDIDNTNNHRSIEHYILIIHFTSCFKCTLQKILFNRNHEDFIYINFNILQNVCQKVLLYTEIMMILFTLILTYYIMYVRKFFYIGNMTNIFSTKFKLTYHGMAILALQ